MKAIAKIYIIIFLLTAIIYFLIMTLFDLNDISKVIILKNITESLFFGILMSIILGSFHWYSLKKDGVKEITEDHIGVNQTKLLETNLNLNDLIQKLKLHPTIATMKMTKMENGVLLKTGMSMKSWGEEIHIILKSNKENHFEYQLSSIPKSKTTVVDYGKNVCNIHKIESIIKNLA
jgi:hypothetical protein